jgi:hypothetical protein
MYRLLQLFGVDMFPTFLAILLAVRITRIWASVAGARPSVDETCGNSVGFHW